MKFLVASVLLALASAAQAAQPAPPCWPAEFGGSGAGLKTGSTADGNWAGWICQVDGKPKAFWFGATNAYKIKHPNITGLSVDKAAAAYWAANVNAPDTAALQRLRIAAMAQVQP